jgi:hypothetical protein
MASNESDHRVAVPAPANSRVLRSLTRQQELSNVTNSTTRELRPSTLQQRPLPPAQPIAKKPAFSSPQLVRIAAAALLPLQESMSFELFPKLPSEIRLKIFEEAASKDVQMLRVHATFHHSDPEMGIYITFKVRPEIMASRNFGLLGACMMSRQVYLKLYRSFLPGGSESRIYYNAKDTVVFIENFTDVIFNARFAKEIVGRYQRQAWFRDIQNLAVPFHLFKIALVRFRIFTGWGNHVPLLHAMRPFKNLERLIGVSLEENSVTYYYPRSTTQEELEILMASDARHVKGALEIYNRLKLRWKVPIVETMFA